MASGALESDAEWVGVDFEFGRDSTTPRPGPRPRPRASPAPHPPAHEPPSTPTLEPPSGAPEKAPSSPSAARDSVGVVVGCVGGVLGVLLILLVVYMFVLRRRLSKAKSSGRDSRYQLRVEDVAHLSHLDETTNTYVNTTDLQKLVASVRAKGKSEGRLPKPPRLFHQTPAPYCPSAAAAGPGDNDALKGDRVVLRAPMPPPHPAAAPPALPPQPSAPSLPLQEVVYSNLQECAAPTRPGPRLEAPKTAPPPPPAKEAKPSVTQPARPAPAPPKCNPPPQASDAPSPVKKAKPVPPLTALKPGKTASGGAKPTPPTLPKPGKGKALPPLKVAVRSSVGAESPLSCPTPDTALTHLSPADTPTGETSPRVESISAKIALIEGHMRTAGGAAPWLGGTRP